MKISIITVASKAGVSKTTVSRFLNGKFEHMKLATREKIAAAIEELEYKPKSYATKAKKLAEAREAASSPTSSGSFSVDYRSGLEKAVQHYSKNGYYAFANFSISTGSCGLFYKTLAGVLQKFSYEPEENVSVSKNDYKKCMGELTALVMKNRDKKIAVFVHGDVLMCFLYSMQLLKLRVPEEVGVCAYGSFGQARDLPGGVACIEVPPQINGDKSESDAGNSKMIESKFHPPI